MTRRLLLILLPIGIGLFAIHGLLLPSGQALAFGPLEVYPDGIARASLILARLFLVLVAGLVTVMTTRLPDLADALEAKGVPAALSFLMTAPLAMAETIATEGRALKEALQVRGIAMRGGPLKRLRALSFIVLPLVRNQLTYAGPRARALDARGFRSLPRRTLLSEPPDSAIERLIRWSAVAVAVLLLSWRVLY